MKNLVIAFLLLTSLARVHADNILENGDFADGTSHWYGDGRPPSDFAPENPLDKPDPFTSKGLIMPLKELDWTRMAQDFKGRIASGILTLTYMLSPDLTFSTKPEDYVNMPAHIHYGGWKSVNTPPGAWVVFIADFGSAHGSYYTIRPNLGSTGAQTYKLPFSKLTPLEDKTITIAFPPGKGTVVILNVSLTAETSSP